jgi:hypothetical protein
MQKFLLPTFFIALFFIAACHNKDAKESSNIIATDDQQSFFPVTDFILGQLNEIDSMPVTPLKITISNDRKDSLWLTKKDIRTFAIPFLHPLIDSASMQNFFAEKSFMDQTINAVTLSYDPKIKVPDSITLTHWDVYIDPQKNTIQRIYLVKENVINGEYVTTQLTWKVNKWCSIRTIEQQPKMPPHVNEEMVKWEFDE